MVEVKSIESQKNLVWVVMLFYIYIYKSCILTIIDIELVVNVGLNNEYKSENHKFDFELCI